MIEAAGYDVVDVFVLPPESWTNEYYGPMGRRVIDFLAAHPGDRRSVAAVVIGAAAIIEKSVLPMR